MRRIAIILAVNAITGWTLVFLLWCTLRNVDPLGWFR